MVCILSSFEIRAQSKIQETISKLELSINGKIDTNQVLILNDLTWYYRSVSQDKALYYGNRALKMAQKLNYLKGIAQSYNDMAIIYVDKKEYENAINSNFKALQIRLKANDQRGIAASYNKLGNIAQEMGQFTKAINYQLKSLEAFEKVNFDFGISTALNNIGVLFFDIKNYAEAEKYHTRSLKIRLKNGDTTGVAGSLSNLGNIYLNQGKLELAEDCYNKAIKTLKNYEDQFLYAIALNNMATLKTKQKKYSQAVSYGLEAYELRKKIGDIKGLASSSANVGYIYTLIGENSKALALFKESEKLSLQIGVLAERENAYKNLWILYEKLGDVKNAFEYSKKHSALKDSILNEESTKIITELSTKYDTEKKERDNRILSNENKIKTLELKEKDLTLKAITFLGIITFMLLLLFFYYRRIKQEKAIVQEKLLQEQNRLKFILVAQEEERKRIAEELHDGVGQMMSAVKLNVAAFDFEDDSQLDHFNNTLKLIDDSCQEIRNISHAMMPGALSKLGLNAALKDLLDGMAKAVDFKINYITNIEGERFPDLIEINIYRITQELIQNAFKYSKAKNLNINLIKKINILEFSYFDDGIGFSIDGLNFNSGNGWGNIKNRINIINGDLKMDSSINKGLKITLEIPIS